MFCATTIVAAANASFAPINPYIASSSDQAVRFTPYERAGVIVMAVAGVISCTFVSTLLFLISLSALFLWSGRSHASQATSTPFINKQIAVFVICLLTSDLIQSISGLTQLKWAAENQLYEGTACSVQAATLVMGDLGSTVWSCVIAAHTFSGIALGRQWSRKCVCGIVVFGWSSVIFLTFLGPFVLTKASKGPFFSLAGTWCFISSEYTTARFLIHYVPLFVASAIILVLYCLVFLVLRGNISFDSQPPSESFLPQNDVFVTQRIAIAKRMLWYPFAYLTCILPIAITRLIGLEEETVPEAVWIFGMFFLFSLGAADSVIYTTTRQLIRPVSLLPVHLRSLSSDPPSTLASSIPKPNSDGK